MSLIKKILIIFFLLFPISNSFGSVTFNQTETFFDDGQDNINGLTLMTKYTRDQAKDNKNDSYIIALDYRGSQRSSYAMSIQDTSAKLSHNKELNGFKINLDSHYDFFKDDPDYGIDLKISNIY